MNDYNFDLVFDLAITSAKFKALEDEAEILSDLGDIKELKSLQDSLGVTLSRFCQKGLIPVDPIKFLRKEFNPWIENVVDLLKRKEALLSEKDLKYLELIKAEDLLAEVDEWLDGISSRFEQLKISCPVQLLKVENLAQKLDELSLYSVIHLPEDQKYIIDIYKLMSLFTGSDLITTEYFKEFRNDVKEQRDSILLNIESQKKLYAEIKAAKKAISIGDFSAVDVVLETKPQTAYLKKEFRRLSDKRRRHKAILESIESETKASEVLRKVNSAIKELGAEKWPESSDLKKYLFAERVKSQSKVRKGRLKTAVILIMSALFFIPGGIYLYKVKKRTIFESRLAEIDQMDLYEEEKHTMIEPLLVEVDQIDLYAEEKRSMIKDRLAREALLVEEAQIASLKEQWQSYMEDQIEIYGEKCSAVSLILENFPENSKAIKKIQTISVADSNADKIKAYKDAIEEYPKAYIALRKPLSISLVTDAKGLHIYDTDGRLFTKGKEFVVDPFVTYNFIAKANGYEDLAFNIGPLQPKFNNKRFDQVLNLEPFVLGRDRKAKRYKILRNGLVHNFYPNGDEAIVDTKTMVMWVKSPHYLPNNKTGKLSKRKADVYVSKLSYAGYRDWRLPLYQEFMSISHFLEFFDLHVTNGWLDYSDCYWSNTRAGIYYETFDVSKKKFSQQFSVSLMSLWPCRTLQH